MKKALVILIVSAINLKEGRMRLFEMFKELTKFDAILTGSIFDEDKIFFSCEEFEDSFKSPLFSNEQEELINISGIKIA
jgi:hypothetical protein